MSNLQQVERRIRELVPSLQELSFGCEIECLYGEGTETILFECGKCRKHKNHNNCDMDCNIDDAYVVKYGYEEEGFGTYTITDKELNELLESGARKYTILGHPIQLHHVLQAIDIGATKGRIRYSFDNKGAFYYTNFDGGNKHITGAGTTGAFVCYWDLTKSLSGQSPECIDFINGIIN